MDESGVPRIASEFERLAGEQAALRRVATLVAHGVPPVEVFRAVADEVSGLFGADVAAIVRFEDDGTATVLGDVGGPHEAGARVSLDPGYVVHTVREAGRSARFDTDDPPAADRGSLVRTLGVQSAVASPIAIEGEVWGAITVASQHGPLSRTAKRRLNDFTALVATALANAQAREEIRVLAEQQAALLRVAELVARDSSSEEVFHAVAQEARGVLNTEAVGLLRFEPDAEAVLVAQSQTPWDPPPLGTRFALDGENVVTEVARTGRAARMDDWGHATGAVGSMADVLGVHSGVATPIVVEGRMWGTMIAASSQSEPLSSGTEHRMEQFTKLLVTAIANADGLDRLMASRARLVTAGDAARRRVVQDLHDGAQQRLVHAIVTLKLARQALLEDSGEVEALLTSALEHAEQGNEQLRELAHGILPTSLTLGGIGSGIEALVQRVDLPVEVDVSAERFEQEIEASAYFIVAEALTNVVKHARANSASVRAVNRDGALHVVVLDDGIGGADRDGHGLTGLADRATALSGRLVVEDAVPCGTRLTATLPLSRGVSGGARAGSLRLG